jgi:hypothetical protein
MAITLYRVRRGVGGLKVALAVEFTAGPIMKGLTDPPIPRAASVPLTAESARFKNVSQNIIEIRMSDVPCLVVEPEPAITLGTILLNSLARRFTGTPSQHRTSTAPAVCEIRNRPRPNRIARDDT